MTFNPAEIVNIFTNPLLDGDTACIIEVGEQAVPIFTITGDPKTYAKLVFSDTTGTAGAVSWSWDFGDGQTSALQSPAHYYQNTGDYDVKLYVTNGNNGTVEFTQNIAITEGNKNSDSCYRKMIVQDGATSVAISQPYYGYTVKVTPKISRTDTTGTKSVSFYDYGSAFDQWSVDVRTSIQDVATQTEFEAMVNNEDNRGKPIVLSLLDGFYPCTPLYPLNASYSVIFLPDKYGHGKQQDKPYLYWSGSYTALVTAKPTASTPTYTSDNGTIRIGTVENLRGLQYHAESKPKNQINYSTKFKTTGATELATVDNGNANDYIETKFELELSDQACAALVKYILVDRNIDNVEIATDKNTYLFGVGYGDIDGSGIYKVHILNEDFEFEHFEFNRWRVTIEARYYETVQG